MEQIMRQDDPDDHTVRLRSKRIVHSDDGWYVGMRDRKLGPFPFRRTAVIELKRYLGELNPQLADPSALPLSGPHPIVSTRS